MWNVELFIFAAISVICMTYVLPDDKNTEEVLTVIGEERTTIHTMRKKERKWIKHILRVSAAKNSYGRKNDVQEEKRLCWNE